MNNTKTFHALTLLQFMFFYSFFMRIFPLSRDENCKNAGYVFCAAMKTVNEKKLFMFSPGRGVIFNA